MESNLSSIVVKVPRTLIDMSKLPPNAIDWFKEFNAEHAVALALSTLFVIIVVSLGFMHLYYIRCYVRNEYAQNDLYYLSLLFPMISLCSLLGMYMPRSARFMFTVCTTYLMVCLFMVVALMRDLFGSRAALSEFLTAWNQKISFQAPPLCCCCPCLPKIKPTEKGLRRIERLVLQSPVVRITLEILNIVLFLEDAAYDKSKLVLEVLEHISFLVALYGCFILMHLGKEKLRPYQFLPIFLFVNLTQIIITLQREIFIVLGRYILFSTTRQPYTQAYFWNGFITTFEMLLLQCSATYLLSPRRCAIFNTFNRAESLDAIDKVDAQALKETEHEV